MSDMNIIINKLKENTEQNLVYKNSSMKYYQEVNLK